MNSKKYPYIVSPTNGTIVEYVADSPFDVYIVGGAYEIGGRVSNFWTFRRVLPDGTLGKAENGYGCFRKSRNTYEIETKIIVHKINK